jgi:hypothetical protein
MIFCSFGPLFGLKILKKLLLQMTSGFLQLESTIKYLNFEFLFLVILEDVPELPPQSI